MGGVERDQPVIRMDPFPVGYSKILPVMGLPSANNVVVAVSS